MTILAWKDTLKKVKEILEKAPIGYCLDYEIPADKSIKEALITVTGKTFVAKAKISKIAPYQNEKNILKKKKDKLKTLITIEKIEEIQDDIVNYEEVSGGLSR